MANWDPVRYSVGTNYKDLLSSNLSEICNNASLILRRIKSLCEDGWPEWFDKLKTDALQKICEDTGLTMREMLGAAACQRALRISSIMRKGARLVLDCVTVDRISGMDTLDLESASSAFLELATDIETLLSVLLFEKERLISQAVAQMLGSTTS
jgi:hypothetical protein